MSLAVTPPEGALLLLPGAQFADAYRLDIAGPRSARCWPRGAATQGWFNVVTGKDWVE